MKVWITVKERSTRSCLLPGRAAGSAAEELPLQPPSPITQHQGNAEPTLPCITKPLFSLLVQRMWQLYCQCISREVHLLLGPNGEGSHVMLLCPWAGELHPAMKSHKTSSLSGSLKHPNIFHFPLATPLLEKIEIVFPLIRCTRNKVSLCWMWRNVLFFKSLKGYSLSAMGFATPKGF